MKISRLAALLILASCLPGTTRAAPADSADSHLLYVAVPGSVVKGREGILVYDIDHGHKLLKRIPIPKLPAAQCPDDIKGICASARTHRLYYSACNEMVCIDLLTDRVLWQKVFDSGCDRMAITPRGDRIYLPSGHWTKTPYWYVIDALTGSIITKIDYGASAHNTVCSLDGSRVYLESLETRSLAVVNTSDNQIIGHVGPFSDIPRPFVINGSRTLCFASVNGLLGFEVADLSSGKVIYRVEVQGFHTGPVRAHSCPTHGIGLTPDETELWAVDAANKYLHVFDATAMPPKPLTNIKLNDQPTWITFSIDGRYAYPATGDVVDTKSRQVVASLVDEAEHRIESEKAVEIVFSNGTPSAVGDQFGLGRATTSPLHRQADRQHRLDGSEARAQLAGN